MKKSSLKLLSLIFSCTVLFSCSNLIDDDTFAVDSNSLEKVTVTGKISVSGAVPAEIANARSASCVTSGRTAIPTMPEGSEYYFFKTRDLDSGVVDDAAGYAYTDGSYEFSLIIGRRFEVTAGISSDDEHNNVILSTSWETPVVTRENAASLGKNIILEPGTEGTGTVELSMTVDSSVYSVSCNNSSFKIKKISDTEYKVIQLGDYIRCGAYSVTFNFWPAGGNALFYNTQTINVFPNMKTDKWVTGVGSLDPIDASGNYNVTSALIEKFARTQIYVGSTSWGNASSSGKGSAKDPFNTFQKAVDFIKDNGDATVDYTIWVSGSITETSTIDSDLDTKAHSITISGTTGNTKDILNGGGSGTVLTINTTVPVTIRNLKITGGYTEQSGGGICINSTNTSLNAIVKLADGAVITGNKAVSDAGGVMVGWGAKLFMYGSALIGDLSEHTATSSTLTDAGENGCANYTEGYGGGIKAFNAEVYLGYSAENTPVKLTGGICRNYGRARGGGIGGLGSNLKIASGNISYNKTDILGGAIFVSGDIEITGDTKIIRNEANDGGGIYVNTGKTLTMTAGFMEANIAEGKGGAVYNEGAFNVSNSVSIPYGGSAKNNDVYLATDKTITLSGALTGTAPVATITVEEWAHGTAVVQADGTNVTDLSTISDITNMFVCSEEKYFTVLSDDKKSLYLDAPIYVSKTVTNAAASKGTKANPYDSIASAISAEMNDSNTDYLIYVVGELTESQTIADTFTKASNAKSLTIKGYDETAAIKAVSNINTPLLSIKTDVPVTIMNLTITGGENSGIKIENSAAEVILGNGAKITGNKGMPAGGIYNNKGTLKILSGAEISHNESYTSNGGGIYNYFGIVTMEGGIISENSGVGIFNYKTGDSVERVTTFEMNGGTISGNTGPAVYNEGVVKISGNAYIPAGTDDNNVVDLAVDTKILITGSLTPPEEANGIAATIKPSDYEKDIQIITAETGINLSNQVGKFAVAPQTKADSSIVQWYISSSGKLTDTMDAVSLSVANYDSVTKLAVTNADGLKTIASLTNSNSKTFEGKTITLQENVSIDSSYTPIGNGTGFKGTFDGNDKQISISNTVVFKKLDYGSTVKNLNLAGSTNKGSALASGEVIGTVEYCTSTVRITDGSSVGGLVYRVMNNGKIQYCINKGTINLSGQSNSASYAGGIAWQVYGGTIDRCINEADITVKNTYVGGITGSISWYGTISNCKNTGTVTTRQSVAGGLVGTLTSQAYIKNCSSTKECSTAGSVQYIIGSGSEASVENTCDHRNYHKSITEGYGYSSRMDEALTTLNEWASSHNAVGWKINGSILELDLSW